MVFAGEEEVMYLFVLALLYILFLRFCALPLWSSVSQQICQHQITVKIVSHIQASKSFWMHCFYQYGLE